jgi:hypothetical protein
MTDVRLVSVRTPPSYVPTGLERQVLIICVPTAEHRQLQHPRAGCSGDIHPVAGGRDVVDGEGAVGLPHDPVHGHFPVSRPSHRNQVDPARLSGISPAVSTARGATNESRTSGPMGGSPTATSETPGSAALASSGFCGRRRDLH